MESTTAGKSKTLIKTAAVAGVLALLLFFVYRGLHRLSLGALVKNDLPMLTLDLRFIDLKGDEVPAAQLAAPVPALGKVSKTGACPEMQGGDIKGGSLADSAAAKDCPKTGRTATWFVKRHAPGVSLSFAEPQRLLPFFQTDKAFKEIWQSRFVQGVLYDPLRSASVRAEDLGLQGLEGAFLARLIKESLAAHARLDYDIVHGKKGFVYSFVRGECPYAAKALPVIVRVLARSGYTTNKLKDPILEMRIGLQRVFIAEYESRIFLANGLEALLNVMDGFYGKGQPPPAPLLLTVDAGAFIDKFFQVMAGDPAFRMHLGFGLDKTSDFLSFPAEKYSRHLRPKIFKGVLAGIPHDAFAAAVTSFYLPPNMSPDQWRHLATEGPGDQPANGPEESGIAFIWDLSSEGQEITNMGVVIASQTSPDDVHRLKNFFVNPRLTADCGGGTVFLAATSNPLLTRMKEACERQSLSVLDWERGSLTEEFSAKQFLFFLNPGTGMRELFLAGGAKSNDQEDTRNQWKEHYEKAKTGMRADSEKVFGGLPIFAYSGNVTPTAKTVQLKGVNVRQGAAQ